MAKFHFIIFSPPQAIDHTLKYMCEALSVCGHQVSVGLGEFHREAINIIPDAYYTIEDAKRLVQIKARDGLRIGVLTTELYAFGTVPYAHHGLAIQSLAHRPDIEARFRARFESLYCLVPEMDFVWSLLERSAAEFAPLAKSSLWFPYGFTEVLPPDYRMYEKDVDVVFIGKATPHRTEVIDRMRSGGISVFAFGPEMEMGYLPEGLLEATLCRAKIGLNLTLTHLVPFEIDPRFASCTRVQQMLARDICVVSEEIPFDNPYARYVINGDVESLGGICGNLLASGAWRDVGLKNGNSFREEMDALRICAPVIDRTLAEMKG